MTKYIVAGLFLVTLIILGQTGVIQHVFDPTSSSSVVNQQGGHLLGGITGRISNPQHYMVGGN